MSDIEDMFNPILRSYKSGKFFVIRLQTEMPLSIVKKNPLSFFDDLGNIVDRNDIETDTEVVCILQLQGLKVSSKMLQLYIELKQVVVLKEENNMFNKLVLAKSSGGANVDDSINTHKNENNLEEIKFK
jgi:hypothetical protein